MSRREHPSRRRAAPAVRRSSRLPLLAAAAAAAVLTFGPAARAQTVTWTGGGSNANWDNFSGSPAFYRNWNTLGLPASGNTVVFGSGFASGTSIALNAARTVAALTIDTPTSFTLSGTAAQSLTLTTGDITRTAASSGNQTISAPVVLNSGGLWTVNGAGSLSLTGPVSGAATVEKAGTGSLTLGAGAADTVANSFTGLTVSGGTLLLNKASGTNAIAASSVAPAPGGTLRLAANDQIADTAVLIMKGGTFDTNSFFETVGSLDGLSGGTIALGTAGGLTLNQSTAGSYTGSFTGTGTFRKNGTGSLTLASAASNSIGSIEAGGGSVAVSGGSYTVHATTGISVDVGTLTITNGATIAPDPGTSASTTRFQVDNGGSLIISGAATHVTLPRIETIIAPYATGSMTIDAATVDGGLYLGTCFAAGSSGTLTIRNAAHVTVPRLFTGGLDVAATAPSTGTTLITGAGTTVTLSDLSIGGANPSQSGGTATVTISASAAVSTTSVNFFSKQAALIVDHATLSTAGFAEASATQPTPGVIQISDTPGGASALTVDTAASTTYNGTISNYSTGPGSLTKAGTGTLVLNNASNSFTGPLSIDAGTVATPALANSFAVSSIGAGSSIRLGSAGAVGTLRYVGTGSAIATRPVTLAGKGGAVDTASDLTLGAVSGPAAFTKLGNGSLILGGLSTTNLQVAGGLLRPGPLNATMVSVAQGATLQLVQNAPGTISGGLTLNSFSTVAVENTTLSVGHLAGNGTIAISDPTTTAVPALTIGTDITPWSYGGAIVNRAGPGSVVKTGTGTASLTGPNTYTGTTAVNAGTLVLNNSLLGPGGAVTISAGATVQAQGVLQRPVAGSGSLAPTGTLVVGDPAAPFSFPGTLAAGANSVLFLSAGVAHLGGQVNLSSGAHLNSLGGLQFDPASTLTATGPFTIDGQVTFLGTVTASGAAATGPVSLTSGTLDLGTTSLTLTNAATASVRQSLLNHQLTSSASDPAHSLGYLFSGDPAAPTSLTVQLTLIGDANLDGKLNADDYVLLDKGFAQHASTWWTGDFNYDGTVDQSDYLLIDATYLQQQEGSPSPIFLSQRESQFGPEYVASLVASVPEPSVSLVFVSAAVASIPRHRRR